MRLTIQDVRKRAASKITHYPLTYDQQMVYESSCEMLANCSDPSYISRYIETAIREGADFSVIIRAFDALCECGDASIISKMGHYIAEEAAPKVRDSSSTLTNIKRKLGRTKTKITTKINKNVQDAIGTGKGAIDAAKRNFKKNTDDIKSNINRGLGRDKQDRDGKPNGSKKMNRKSKKKAPVPKQKLTKEEAIIYAYEEITEAVNLQVHCDRILENYDKMSRRFNLDRLIVENTRMHGIEDTIYQLARWSDTYNMPDMVKFNCVLECAWYGFNTNGIHYTDEQLIEYAQNYFLLKEDGAANTAKIIDTAMVVDGNGVKEREVINEDLPEEREDIEDDMEDVNECIDVEDAIGRYMEFVHSDHSGTVHGVMAPVQEEVDFNKIFKEYKKKEEKDAASPGMLKSLFSKLYSNSVDNAIEGTPSLLSWIRGTLIISAFAINPIIGAMGFIVNYFMKQDHDREDYQKMIKAFKAEKKAAQEKYKSLTDTEEKDRMNSYIEELDSAIKKLNDRYESLLSDAELDAKYEDDSESDDDEFEVTGDEDFGDLDDIDISEFEDEDWNDDDFGDLDEAVKLLPVIGNMMSVIESYMNHPIPVHRLTEGMEEFSTIAAVYPSIFNCSSLRGNMIRRKNGINSNQIKLETVSRYTAMSSLDNSIRILETPVLHQDIDGRNIFAITKQLYYPALAIKEAGIILECQAELDKGVMLESSFANKLTMALDKLKKGAQKLSDKEKQASRTIDSTANRMSKGIEKAFTTDNREAVIKGTILPSASKTLKIALATGGLALFQPVLAVIGLLGYIGCAKTFKAKERQMVLDEIEIELKMVDKYLQIAEDKNDMKATKQLLTTKRELERQHQRIKYNMKVHFNQSTNSTNPDGSKATT